MTKLNSLPKAELKVFIPLVVKQNLQPSIPGRGNRAVRRYSEIERKEQRAMLDFLESQLFRTKGLTRLCEILNRTSRRSFISIRYED